MEKNDLCPVCNSKGIKVKSITVKHLVIDELADQISDDTYFICMNEDCDVVYYKLNNEKIFYIKEVKVPVWLKKDASPKFICYCNQVTEQQIINAVALLFKKLLVKL